LGLRRGYFEGEVDDCDLEHGVLSVDEYILRVNAAVVKLVLIEELEQLQNLVDDLHAGND
jgi:hypothetical protein